MGTSTPGARIHINGRYALLANGGIMPWMAWMNTHEDNCPGVTELDLSLIPEEAFDEDGWLDYDDYRRTAEARKAARAEKARAKAPVAEPVTLPSEDVLRKMTVEDLRESIKHHFGVEAEAKSKGMLLKEFVRLSTGPVLE